MVLPGCTFSPMAWKETQAAHEMMRDLRQVSLGDNPLKNIAVRSQLALASVLMYPGCVAADIGRGTLGKLKKILTHSKA